MSESDRDDNPVTTPDDESVLTLEHINAALEILKNNPLSSPYIYDSALFDCEHFIAAQELIESSLLRNGDTITIDFILTFDSTEDVPMLSRQDHILEERMMWQKEAYEDIDQWENWLNLRDMANGIKHGFARYRFPTPGQEIDVEEAQVRVQNIEDEWLLEGQSRQRYMARKLKAPFIPPIEAPAFTECSIQTQCYMHSILESRISRSKGIFNNFDEFDVVYSGSSSEE